MDDPDMSYLLGRCRSHRTLARITSCAEARCIHQQFVSSYQRRLLALRRARASATPMYQERLAA